MATSRGNRFVPIVRATTRYWAYIGGALVFAIVMVNVYSIVGMVLFRRPFPGVYEIVQVGTAVAMFMFLPYCQITGSNVTADVFTTRLRRRTVVRLGGLGALLGLAFALFLLWRMGSGLNDVYVYRETTAIYQFPIWVAYVPILASLVLLSLAAIANLAQARRGVLPEDVGDP